jgi:hypothetical protein
LYYSHYPAISTRIRGGIMLGYTKEDLDAMTLAVESALTTVNFDNDPWLHTNLYNTVTFLQGLEAEGYFQ